MVDRRLGVPPWLTATALSLAIQSLALGAPARGAGASDPALISTSLESDIHLRKGGGFDALLARWEKQYGASAVAPLLKLAQDRALDDTDRYVALMGAAKLGGVPGAPLLVPFLKDRSWMIRSASLRALAALGNPATADATLPLLRDAALVVRVEAVEAVAKLRPAGAAEALVAALTRGENYHGGKAQWVPDHALRALVALGARETAPRLRPLLDHTGDPELLARTVETLDALAGHAAPDSKVALKDRVRDWKLALADGGAQRMPAGH
jgi:HEAT repeat protein